MLRNKYYDLWWSQFELRRKYPIEILWNEYVRAYYVWLEHYYQSEGTLNHIYYQEWINKCPHVGNGFSNSHSIYDIRVSEETYTFIKHCLSPNAAVLMKILKIREQASKEMVEHG